METLLKSLGFSEADLDDILFKYSILTTLPNKVDVFILSIKLSRSVISGYILLRRLCMLYGCTYKTSSSILYFSNSSAYITSSVHSSNLNPFLIITFLPTSLLL